MSGPNDFEIRVDVSIQNYPGGGNLRLSEQVMIPDCTFNDMAEILGSFHGLAKSIKEAKAKVAAQT